VWKIRGRKATSLTTGAGKTERPHVEDCARPLSPSQHKNQFRMNQRSSCMTWNFESTMGNPWRYRHRHHCLNGTPITQEQRIGKWDCLKLKSLCTAKEAITRMKGQPTEWEKIFVAYLSEKGLIFRKQAGRMAHAVACLFGKCKALSSHPRTTKKTNKQKS
jgi:hypothetical protein